MWTFENTYHPISSVWTAGLFGHRTELTTSPLGYLDKCFHAGRRLDGNRGCQIWQLVQCKGSLVGIPDSICTQDHCRPKHRQVKLLLLTTWKRRRKQHTNYQSTSVTFFSYLLTLLGICFDLKHLPFLQAHVSSRSIWIDYHHQGMRIYLC